MPVLYWRKVVQGCFIHNNIYCNYCQFLLLYHPKVIFFLISVFFPYFFLFEDFQAMQQQLVRWSNIPHLKLNCNRHLLGKRRNVFSLLRAWSTFPPLYINLVLKHKVANFHILIQFHHFPLRIWEDICNSHVHSCSLLGCVAEEIRIYCKNGNVSFVRMCF